jgi:hypothetical protein
VEERPLAPFLGAAAETYVPEAEERPLEPFLRPGAQAAGSAAEETARESFLDVPAKPVAGGFTFARVGDVAARAQRLARALISDIHAYQPRKVEQGLREGSLKEVLKEEVEKSWDEYCERLGPDVARANRVYFVEALNEILAEGRPVF